MAVPLTINLTELPLAAAAVGYAEQGLAVVPCQPGGKAPLWGLSWEDVSADPEQVAAWWSREPRANIGLACIGDLVVLDIDGADGEATLAELQARHGPLPITYEVRTGRGRHLYFRRPEGLPKGWSHGGLDLKANGYVLAWPSVHPSGAVYWLATDTERPELPEWLKASPRPEPERRELPVADRQDPERLAAAGRAALEGELDKLRSHPREPDSNRHTAVFAAAAALGHHVAVGGLSELLVRTAVLEAALFIGLPDDRETAHQVTSGLTKGMAEPYQLTERGGYVVTESGSASEDTDHGLGAVPEYPAEALPSQARALMTGTLPGAAVAGAALAALAAAIGPRAQVQVTSSWLERPILWVVNVAPRGAGKSPAQAAAFAPLRDYDAALGDEESPLLLGDFTLESVARDLAAGDGGAAVDVDELAQLLRGLGEYKGRGGGDRGRLLSLWSGAPWSYRRVGTGKSTNAVTLRIPQPTLVICGGLQPALHPLLGGDEDGLRPRWLPHLAELPQDGDGSPPPLVNADPWGWLITDLLRRRDHARRWELSTKAAELFHARRRQWKAEARGAEAPSVTAALVKADVHAARIALVLAEAEQPGADGGTITAATMERAAAVVQFTLDCWRALPDQGEGLGLSWRDRALNAGVRKLVAFLEERPDRQATRREVQRARVAGARKPGEVDALLADYELTYPGSLLEVTPSRGGRPVVIVKAPIRRGGRELRTAHAVADGDSETHADANPRGSAEFGAVGTGDNGVGDTGGDTAPSGNGRLFGPDPEEAP